LAPTTPTKEEEKNMGRKFLIEEVETSEGGGCGGIILFIIIACVLAKACAG
jgi:hypothetical protein